MTSFSLEVFGADEYPERAAAHIAALIPAARNVVITGGNTAAAVYGPLAAATRGAWDRLDVLFSDERCVPPDDDASNYRMARATLLDAVRPRTVHRIRGEDDPAKAATAYAESIAPTVASGLDVTILGMGADCHICALFPGSPAFTGGPELAMAVDRPDGLKGVTLTPAALRHSHKVVVIVTGDSKADAAGRALAGDQPVTECPVRVLDGLDVTFLVDEPAAAGLR